ncbi:aminopeptidase [Spirosoma sp. KUDC1026]|uniref:aminopeptidase n=1 Tax=Spirosoma sp. KUDC1026 TaxID=2745947 RepID=UPI00159B85A7|nr:aminopeptidase [Spirosoma sp. KUDC1026]QKZ12329.1 aminopeptidase [Spirosoma sp. KUDC1026]
MGKKIALGSIGLLLILIAWQWELVSYGWMQAKGQLTILWNTKPVADVLADPAYPDSLKQKIKLIQEIKRFSIDSLGLDPSGSYESFYDQQGKPILWVITAAQPYQLVAQQWHFPILGTFSYKGFFEKDRADQQLEELKTEGLDTRVGEVSAWSTLGFLNDPILSSFLARSEGSLAELIIHELTHGTLFVKNSLEYNENLADFVGEYGAARFLAQKYGPASVQYKDYEAAKVFYGRYDEHVLKGAQLLDSLYKSFKPTTSVAIKDSLKWQTIRQIVVSSDTIRDERSQSRVRSVKKGRLEKLKLPNNAYFIGYLTYRKQQNRFRQEFEKQFNSDFTRYLTYLKQTYPSF